MTPTTFFSTGERNITHLRRRTQPYGLGVHSWGFEQIIKNDPTTARNEGRMAWGLFAPDNGVAMGYHSDSARQWMRDIVDLCVK
jgi:hypothetical protein